MREAKVGHELPTRPNTAVTETVLWLDIPRRKGRANHIPSIRPMPIDHWRNCRRGCGRTGTMVVRTTAVGPTDRITTRVHRIRIRRCLVEITRAWRRIQASRLGRSRSVVRRRRCSWFGTSGSFGLWRRWWTALDLRRLLGPFLLRRHRRHPFVRFGSFGNRSFVVSGWSTSKLPFGLSLGVTISAFLSGPLVVEFVVRVVYRGRWKPMEQSTTTTVTLHQVE